jgi:hypothetical protein
MMGVRKIREWYRKGGRLRLPYKFIGKEDAWRKGKYRVVAAKVGEISEEEYEVWWWLRKVMAKSGIILQVAIDRYLMKVSATGGNRERWMEVEVMYRDIVIVIERERDYSVGVGVSYKEMEEGKRVEMLLEYLKLEIEERLNGLLERVLFK